MSGGMNARSLPWPPAHGAPCWTDATGCDDEFASHHPCALVDGIRNSTMNRLQAAVERSSDGGGIGETYRRLNEALGWSGSPARDATRS